MSNSAVASRNLAYVPLLALALTLAISAPAAQQPKPFTADTNLVVVPVVVVDRSGKTIADLTSADFEVTEDGTPVPIQTFVRPIADGATGETGRFIVLALDNIMTAPEIAFRVRNIAKLFVERMGPGDVLSVITINGGQATTTTNKDDVLAAIDRFTSIGAPETWGYADRSRHGLRMISSLAEQTARAPHPRKVLVFIGDGNLFSPIERSAFDNTPLSHVSPEWTDAVRATSRHNVATYTIDPKGIEGGIADWSQSFAVDSGGNAWSGTNNYRGAIDRIWEESARYYLIGYAAPVNDLALHQIRVKVNRPGVTVRARRTRG